MSLNFDGLDIAFVTLSLPVGVLSHTMQNHFVILLLYFIYLLQNATRGENIRVLQSNIKLSAGPEV